MLFTENDCMLCDVLWRNVEVGKFVFRPDLA
jgi:hypothetical protein